MKNKNSFYICLILVITGIIYLPSINNEFTNFDDKVLVVENTKITELSWKNVLNIFTSLQENLYHPLVFLSYSIEYKYFKLNPKIYHITNLGLHLFNCILVYWMLLLISKNKFVTFLTSLLFGIHPLHVESVAWISERKDVLYSFFFLASIISYIYYTTKKQKIFYTISLLLFILSLLSKPMAVTLPFVLLLYDYFIEKKFNSVTVIKKLPFFILSFIFGIITIIAQKSAGNIRQEQSFTFIGNILNACYGIIFYLQKMFLPLKLSCIYPFTTGKYKLSSSILIISFILVIILLAILIYNIHKRKNSKFLFGTLFFLITILPVLNIIPVGRGIPADRYTYIPLIGLFYLISELLYYLYYKEKKLRLIIIPGLVIVIMVLAYLTHERCNVWKDSIALWSDVINKYPEYAMAYNSRGIEYANRNELEKSISDYNKAIAIDPGYAEAFNHRGIVYFMKGEYEKALNDYQHAILLDRRLAIAYSNLGNLYMFKGDFDNAIINYNKAIELNPEYADAYFNRGNAYGYKKQYDNAISDYNKAIELKPNFIAAYNNRGVIYFMMNDYNRAWQEIMKIRALGAEPEPGFLNDLETVTRK